MKIENLAGYQAIRKFAKGKGAFISITYGCQCRCKHCGVSLFSKKDDTVLKTEDVKKKILDRLKDCGIDVAYFFGGEPTLHKDFIELVRYATQKGLYTRADTNGIKLADKDFAKSCKDAGTGFFLVSLDSVDPKVHDGFRGLPGSWEKAVQAIKNCVELGIKVGITTVVTKQNLKHKDTEKIIQLGKDLGAFRIRLLAPMMVGRWTNQDIKLTPEEIKQLQALLEPGFVFWEEWCDGSVPFTCASITKWVIAISAYGDVQPCCYIPVKFGNLRKVDLKTIVDKMWDTNYFKIERENINRCDCPMNDAKMRNKLLKLYGGKKNFPVDYEDKLFRAD